MEEKRFKIGILPIVVGLLTVTFVAISIVLVMNITETMKEIDEVTESLNSTNVELVEVSNEEQVTIEDLEATAYSATNAGIMLTTMQNDRIKGVSKLNDDEFYSTMKEYIYEDYHHLGVDWFNYELSNDGKPVTYSWKFETTYDLAVKNIDALWVAMSDDGENLIAYMTGVYNADDKKFKNLELVVSNNAKSWAEEYTSIKGPDLLPSGLEEDVVESDGEGNE